MVKFPSGTEGEYTIRFNANGAISDGAVFVVMVNGRFALVRQWRSPLSRWTVEIPRGFGDKADNARTDKDKGIESITFKEMPINTVLREFQEEVSATAKPDSITYLGALCENSGTHNVLPSFYLVTLKVDEASVAKLLVGSETLQSVTVVLWDKERIQAELGKEISDFHSVCALTLALNHLDHASQ